MTLKIRNQNGGILVVIISAIAGLFVVGIVASFVFGMIRGNSDASNRTTARALIAQAAYTLTVESSDTDGDGVPESPAMLTAVTPIPTGGGQIPASSGAPKTDAWGTAFGYCAYDNGSTNSSTGRINGDNPATQNSVVFALISGGPNKTFDTTCAQAMAGTAVSDDIVRYVTVAQVLQGVGGTVYYGDPVANYTALTALNTATLKVGHQRLVLDTNSTYRWDGTAWILISSGSGSGSQTLTPFFDDFSTNTAADYTAWAGGVTVSGGVANGAGSSLTLAYHKNSTNSNDNFARGYVSMSGNDSGGVCVRVNKSASPVTAYCVQLMANQLRIYSYAGASGTLLASSPAIYTAAQHEVMISANGSLITVYGDYFYQPAVQVTSTTYTTGTYAGVLINRANANAAVWVDNLQAGALTPTSSSIRTQAYYSAGSYSFVVPRDVDTVYLTATGAGGGGGGGASSGIVNDVSAYCTGGSGGNGGAGQSSLKYPIRVTPGETLSVSIGGGGAAGSAGCWGSNGGAGGTGGNTVVSGGFGTKTLYGGTGGGGGTAGSVGGVPCSQAGIYNGAASIYYGGQVSAFGYAHNGFAGSGGAGASYGTATYCGGAGGTGFQGAVVFEW